MPVASNAAYGRRRFRGNKASMIFGVGATRAGSTSVYLTAISPRNRFKLLRSPKIPQRSNTRLQCRPLRNSVAALLMPSIQSSFANSPVRDRTLQAWRRRNALQGEKHPTSSGWRCPVQPAGTKQRYRERVLATSTTSTLTHMRRSTIQNNNALPLRIAIHHISNQMQIFDEHARSHPSTFFSPDM